MSLGLQNKQQREGLLLTEASCTCDNSKSSSGTTAQVMMQLHQLNGFCQESRLGSFSPSSSRDSPCLEQHMERKRNKRINFSFSLTIFQLQSEVHCCHTRDISRRFLPLNSFTHFTATRQGSSTTETKLTRCCGPVLQHWCLAECLRKLICLKTNNAKKKAGKGRAKVTSSVVHVSTALCQERWQRKRSAAAIIPARVLKLNCEGKPLQWNRQLPLTGRLTPSHAVPPLRSGWLLHFSDRTSYLLGLRSFGSAHKDDLSLWRAGQVPMLTARKQEQPVGRTRSGNQVHPFWQQLNTGLAQAPHTTTLPLLLHKGAHHAQRRRPTPPLASHPASQVRFSPLRVLQTSVSTFLG